MLEFKEPTLNDRDWINECLKYAHSMNCEYSFGNIYIWRISYTTKVAHFKNFLLIRYGRGENIGYSPPIGCGDYKEAIEEIFKDAKKNNVKPRFLGTTVSYKDIFEINFPGKFSFKYDDANNDYIYEVEKMATLSGKKYHGKRNHITNFKKTYPNWKFEKITKKNINDCIELHTNWIDEKDEQTDLAQYSLEFEAVLCALENYDVLNLVGGILKIDETPIAYTIGERVNDECFVTHFEKAPPEIRGAFPVINQEFTKECLMSYKYVNREEDLGIDGLRRAKRSYYPEIFLEKCVATYEG